MGIILIGSLVFLLILSYFFNKMYIAYSSNLSKLGVPVDYLEMFNDLKKDTHELKTIYSKEAHVQYVPEAKTIILESNPQTHSNSFFHFFHEYGHYKDKYFTPIRILFTWKLALFCGLLSVMANHPLPLATYVLGLVISTILSEIYANVVAWRMLSPHLQKYETFWKTGRKMYIYSISSYVLNIQIYLLVIAILVYFL